jgi:acyl-CoA thioester hydrolase
MAACGTMAAIVERTSRGRAHSLRRGRRWTGGRGRRRSGVPRPALPLPAFVSRAEPAHGLTLAQVVAFRDCDPMGVLWHGNYLAYCEAARDALGERLGLGVRHFHGLGLFAPVVRSQVLHQRALRPGDALRTTVELYATRQPRLYHRYRLEVDGACAALAETEQVLTDRAFTLLLVQPEALAALLA